MTTERLRPFGLRVGFCLALVVAAVGIVSDVYAGILAHQKISATQGGFTGLLADGNRFGISCASIGDLDGDGVIDLAVGAYFDNDGGIFRGAVWVLFLNLDGTVKAQQKISDTQGGFTGTLIDGDFFGNEVAPIGDLDDDGVVDLAVGAWGDDDGGERRGAVWILFLNSNGTVKSHQKISDTQGGFTGTLNDEDAIGSSLTFLGDLDGDGVGDLATGAIKDDDGGSNRGAVWVLFLNNDGTVKSHQKISHTVGGFGGTVTDEGRFGRSVSSLGDLDGDNVTDLAVGAFRDSDGGPERGSVWILFLNNDGTVKSQQKISDTQGGFGGTLDDFDVFGGALVSLGDQDGDGIGDLAVGAHGDDDGGTDRGAVWTLFLNSDGTVKSQEKISSIQGGFTGSLDNRDSFGISLTSLGDLDGDAVNDLVAGAFWDDDGGPDRGAVWVLFGSACSVRPSSIDFDTLFVGESKDTTFTIINGGGGSIGGTVFESCPDYSILSGGGGYLLAPGESLIVAVRFEPVGPGGDCVVSTGAPCSNVLLTGVGVQCVVQPLSIDFDTVDVDVSKDSTFAIVNVTPVPVTGNVTLSSCPDYSIVSGAGPYTLAAGETLSVMVRFTPASEGARSCTVQTGACGNVLLTGVGKERRSALITSIVDDGSDQGGEVRINFLRSFFDVAGSPTPILQYEAYRRIDPLPAAPMGVAASLENPQTPGDRVRRAREAGMVSDPVVLDAGWDFVGAVPAHIAPEYNMIAPTLADSTITKGMHWSVFFIRAATADPATFFDSPADSGFSLDNLAPVPPTGLAVTYNTGTGNEIVWDPSDDGDFETFRVYRGMAPGFTPGPVTLVHSTGDIQWMDPVAEGWKYHYKLTAEDVSGNESDPSAPGTVTGIDAVVPQVFALHQNVPNPFNPVTKIVYDVPAGGGQVTVVIYDVQGRLLRTLVDGRETPGSKTVTWDGRDNQGQRVASGVYFYRMQAGDFTRTLKMVLMK